MQNSIYHNVPKKGFTPEEFEARLLRAQKIMHKWKLDAIFLTTPPNIRYFSGFDTQFWESPTRPWFLVIPLEGKPIAVIPEIGKNGMALTWVDDIRTWHSPNPIDDGVSLLQSTIEEQTKKFNKVGAELGKEMSIRMPIIDFDKIRENVSSRIIDGSPAIWEMRMVKTASEVKHIDHICKIASDAYNTLPKNLSIGETEHDAVRKLRIDIANKGADATPFMPAVSGPGGVPQIICGPTDRILEKGDILFIDMLKSNGIRMAVCSGALLSDIKVMLKDSDLAPAFETIVAAHLKKNPLSTTDVTKSSMHSQSNYT